MDTIKITLIVPVFDTPEKLLKKCLDSIALNYDQAVEVIFIDDCSDEATARMITQFCEIHQLSTIYQRNLFNCGSSYGRNLGISLAHGEWISFLDCDDYLEPDWCRNALDSIRLFGEREHIIQFNHYTITDRGRLIGVIKGSEFVENIPNMPDKLVFVWNKLFKASLIKNHQIFFPVGLTPGEDNYFSYLCYFHAGSMMHVEWYGVNHVYREGSVGSKKAESAEGISKFVIWHRLHEECLHRKFPKDVIAVVEEIMKFNQIAFMYHITEE